MFSNGLNANQILTAPAGALVGAATFGKVATPRILSDDRIVVFTADGSVATATGFGAAAGAYPAGTGLTTGSTEFDSVLNHFNWDGGPKTITLKNLQVGEHYSVQLLGVDDRNTGGGESHRLANFQNPSDPGNVSTTFKMGDNVYVVGTFTASGAPRQSG